MDHAKCRRTLRWMDSDWDNVVRTVDVLCANVCPSTCSVAGVAPLVLGGLHPLVQDALVAAGVEGVAGALSAYVCSPEVYDCLVTTVNRNEGLTTCLTAVGGTFGERPLPWTTRDTFSLRAAILALVVCVAWNTVFSTMVVG